MHLFDQEKNFDFVAIGDIATDAFIKLNDAAVTCNPDGRKCELKLRFGDKVPYEFMEEVNAVGNSANASVCARRLGLKSALVSNVGDDHGGAMCIATLRKNGVSSEFITTHKDKNTNYHYVLWFEDDRTILVKHEKFEYKFLDIGMPKWVYLSSLGENAENYYGEISKYLNDNPEVKLAFQPGTFQIKMGVEKLKEIYKRSDILFCNVDEARRILKSDQGLSVTELLKGIHNIGPNLVVITDGAKGAYAFDGYEGYFIDIYPDQKPPYERTGAGDSFSATFVSAIALGRSLFDALMWAPINAMSVVRQIGAQKGLLTENEILKYLSQAPEDYKPKKMA